MGNWNSRKTGTAGAGTRCYSSDSSPVRFTYLAPHYYVIVILLLITQGLIKQAPAQIVYLLTSLIYS